MENNMKVNKYKHMNYIISLAYNSQGIQKLDFEVLQSLYFSSELVAYDQHKAEFSKIY